MATTGASRDTRAAITYVNPSPAVDPDELLSRFKPGMPPEAHARMREQLTETRVVTLVDARSAEGGLGSWNLDTHGFMCFTPPPLDGVDFTSYKAVRAEYYPRLAELVRKITAARGAYVFQHQTRDEPGGPEDQKPRKAGAPKRQGYADVCHTDYGAESPALLREFLVSNFQVPEEEAEGCEMMVANVWFPWDRPAYLDPLCILDASSVRWPEEVFTLSFSTISICLSGPPENAAVLVQKEFIRRSYVDIDHLACPRFSPTHRWVFCPDMRTDEAWLFKQIDTREGRARQCFHTAFKDPFHEQKPDVPGRRSAEFRILLTFPKHEKGGAATPAPTSKL